MSRGGSAGSSHRAPPAQLALVERDEAWKRASHAIGLARGGTGSVLMFEGSSGLGKSGLIEAVRALAAESGVRTLRAAGRHRESDFAFGVVLQLFESGDSARRGRSPFNADWLEAARSDTSYNGIHSIYRAYAELAHESPLLVLVDDADLADPQSLRVLLYLTERVAELPIAIILTAGRLPPRRAPELLAEIARHSNSTLSRLEPLTAQGTARRLAKTTLSAAAEAAAAEIHLAGGGNPFVIDKLAEALAKAEESNGEHPPEEHLRSLACPGIAEWALVRAAELDPAAPELLKAVAVLGSKTELRHACAVAGLEPGPAGEVVDLLADVGLLVRDDRLSFAQPAVASAIERAQTPSERGARCLRAANILVDEGDAPDRIADLLLKASRMGSAGTVEALSMAAAVSLGRANPFAAVRYLARALEEPPPPDLRPHVVLELGRAEAMAGEPDAATHLATGISQLSDRSHDPGETLITGRTLFALGRPGDALAAFDRTLEATEESDPEAIARLSAARTTVQWLTGLLQGTRAELPPPAVDVRTASDRAYLALHALDGAIRGRRSEEVRELAERALGWGALLDEETSEGWTYYLAALALVFAGDLQMAEAALTAAVHDAQSRGSVLGFATASHLRALAILRRGRLPDAALDARCALATERDGWRTGAGTARAVLARVAIERGDHETAARHLDAAEVAIGAGDVAIFQVMSARGRLALYSGDAESAFRLFMDCGQQAERAGITNPAVVAWRADAGLATAVIGDWSEAERMIETELSLANDFGEPATIGRALCALGSIREPASALEAFEAAVHTLEDSHAALDRATALVEFGAALRRSGRRRDARMPLRAGLELAERCGADALATRARREARVAGAKPRRTALHGAEALTTRERQVASLAADGLSNREIAEKLVVTVKTVEWHLKNSFVKLDVSSRTDLRGKLSEPIPD
jgi:DNA-binding CsgD family transcriptional regulator